MVLGSLRLFADLYHISFGVRQFKEASSASILNRAGRTSSSAKLFMRLLEVCAEQYRVVVAALISGVFSFGPVAQKNCRSIGSRQLQGYVGGEWAVPISRNSRFCALEHSDPPLLLNLNAGAAK